MVYGNCGKKIYIPVFGGKPDGNGPVGRQWHRWIILKWSLKKGNLYGLALSGSGWKPTTGSSERDGKNCGSITCL
jgi:hypothetical protein